MIFVVQIRGLGGVSLSKQCKAFSQFLWERIAVLAEVDFSESKATGVYVCSICGYVYDPAEHDGTAFEELPDDWKCPRCKQGKEKFNKA